MSDKSFKTLEERIETLEQKNLEFKNSGDAKYVPMNNSYYGLINRYKELFSISTQNTEGDSEDGFQGDYFKDLLSIYDFDKNLSSLLYKYFSMIEVTLKTSYSYYISLYVGEMQTNYLDKNNYSWGYIVEHGKMKGRPSRKVTIDHLGKCIKKGGGPSIEYYKKEHNNIPPWISIPALSLGAIYELYRICPKEAKGDIPSVFMKPEVQDISAQKSLLIRSLEFIHIYRNRVIHG